MQNTDCLRAEQAITETDQDTLGKISKGKASLQAQWDTSPGMSSLLEKA